MQTPQSIQPVGSITRKLALLRHAALDMADLQADRLRMSQAGEHGGVSAEDFIEVLIARLADWLSQAKRERLLARFELFLIASRDPELAAVVNQQRQQFLVATQVALHHGGPSGAVARAPMLLAAFDALLLDHVSASGPLVSVAAQRQMFCALLGVDAESRN